MKKICSLNLLFSCSFLFSIAFLVFLFSPIVFAANSSPAEVWSGTFSGSAGGVFVCATGDDAYYEESGSFSFSVPYPGMAAARERISALELDGRLSLVESGIPANGNGCDGAPSVSSSSISSLPVKVYINYLGIQIESSSTLVSANLDNIRGKHFLNSKKLHFDPFEETANAMSGSWSAIPGADAQGNVMASGEFELTTGAPSPVKNCEESLCKVKISSDFDGVSADGASNITFTMEVSGEYSKINFDLQAAMAGEILGGKLEKITPTKIVFTPIESGKGRNYLPAQEAVAIGSCLPKKPACSQNAPQKYVDSKEFTIEQPPLFFVHGFNSGSDTWTEFERKAGLEGWWYDDIDYGGKQNNLISVAQLGKKLSEFITKIKTGGAYGGKKISATKLDVIAHSMGGIVIRYYIGSIYEGNIRKLITIGSPNHGAWDPNLVPKIFGGIAAEQTTPGSEFMNFLEKTPKNKDIDYYGIAGVGWLTDTGLMQDTFNGDGLIPRDSVKLEGAPIFCTYDAHASAIYWLALPTPAALANNGGSWTSSDGGTLTSSKESYKIMRDLILTGNAQTVVDCYKKIEPDTRKITIGQLKSQATLHAYDEFGNHVGLNSKGELENQIGEGVFYSANHDEAGGQVIKIIGDKKIEFVIDGKEKGKIGFETIVFENGKKVFEKSFDSVEIDENTQYAFDPSGKNLELEKQTKDANRTPTNGNSNSDWNVIILISIMAAIAIALYSYLFFVKTRQKK